MIALLLAAAFHSGDAPDCTGPASPTRLLVRVEGVRSSRGLVAVSLYPDERRRFLAKRGALYVGRVPAVQGATDVCIHVPRPGIYAVAVYHDADADRKFDRTALGLPDEGFGFSNNPRTFLGMPNFSSVRTPVRPSGTRTTIRLTYR
ncbi:MAG: DUF2141 domain-containing protein [Allosphingosinicella sp.]